MTKNTGRFGFILLLIAVLVAVSPIMVTLLASADAISRKSLLLLLGIIAVLSTGLGGLLYHVVRENKPATCENCTSREPWSDTLTPAYIYKDILNVRGISMVVVSNDGTVNVVNDYNVCCKLAESIVQHQHVIRNLWSGGQKCQQGAGLS